MPTTQARDELNKILDALLDAAKDMLKKNGEFYPFGGSVDSTGQFALIGAQLESDRPPSDEVVDLLYAAFRSQAADGLIRALGVCYDVRFRNSDGSGQTDAVAVSLEHRDPAEAPITVVLPYSKSRFRGVQFRELTAIPAEGRVFGAGDQPAAT